MRLFRYVAIPLLALTALLPGCSPGEKTYHLSGAITYQGKPVPAGTVVFEPDPTANNSGPSGFAKIKDGQYDTRILDGRGTVGGPHLVRILGQEGIPRGDLINGYPLFPEHTITADLPKKDATHDFEIPKSPRG
jgi:hypothetical protein